MKILIATDGSKASEAAVKYAARLYKSMKDECHITLITVQDDSSLRLFKKYTPKGTVDDYLREGADNNLAWAIKFGHPAEQIIKESKSGAFDMIVMGTKGRSTWSDTLLGSVAQRVSGLSKIPVLLVKA